MTEKQASIKLLGDAKDAYLNLKKIVEEERIKGATSSFNQTLLKSIEDKIAILKKNYDFGTHIPKNRIGHKYINEIRGFAPYKPSARAGSSAAS